MPVWVNEASWPEAWPEDSDIGIYFSPIAKSGSEYIVYATGYGILKLYKYNLTTQTWTYLNTTPVQLYRLLSMSPDGTKLAGTGINSKYLYIYDIAGNSWTTSAAAPNLTPTGEAPRICGMSWADNDTIWCHINDMSGNLRHKAYKYVVSTDTWSQGVNQFSGTYASGEQLSLNTAKTAVFFGPAGWGGGGFDTLAKYTIATDTYTEFTFPFTNGYNFVRCDPHGPFVLFIDGLTSYDGYKKFNCDTEIWESGTVIFPDDKPIRNHSAVFLPAGLYDLVLIIAYHHKAAEPHDRSYFAIVAPTTTTDPATLITHNGGTLNGTLVNDGGQACNCGFEWGETPAYGNTTPTQSKTTGQTFAQAISGLDPSKTYHFRAFAINSAGTGYGADRTFTTTIDIPAVTTNPVTALSAMAATENGLLDDDGGEICSCGFQWGRSVAYGGTTPTQSKNTGQTFSEIIAPLDPDTEYHFRAFAINSAGTGYGADRSFRTYPAMSQGYALSRSEL